MKPDAPPPPDKHDVDTDAATLLRPHSMTRPRQTHDPAQAPTLQFLPSEAEGGVSQSGPVDANPRPLAEHGFEDRYQLGRVLGEGGMGEVRRCTDEIIGRDVAMKVIRPGHGSRSDMRERFEREARIQGQLEHPSIVPVYDLGLNPDGSAYFTMKRIVGRTLEEILTGLRAEDPEIQQAYSRRKLLSGFSNVCLTIAFAHQRGVVHRDLKPANIILGSFGEVYVLDWGVAKILPASDAAKGETARAETVVAPTADGEAATGDSGATAAGTLMGTPGYMAPEQAAGEVELIDGRADLYALGAILFEILSLRPLHEGRTTEHLIASTLAGANAQVGERAGAPAPPELEAICVQATALDPADRYQNAREMHEAVERYLDGDRDLQRRREMARQHAQNAQQALTEADGDPSQAAPARSRAMRELNAALTLDPTNEGALATMMKVLVGSASDMPADAEAELELAQHRGRLRGARRAAIALLSLYLFLPLLLWLGVRNHLALSLMGVFILLGAMSSYWVTRLSRMKPWHFYVVAALPMVIAGLCGLFCGPFVIVPGAVLAMGLPVIVNVRASRPQRIYVGALGVLAVLLPLGLQQLGWLPPFYELRDGVITILPWTVHFPPVPTHLFLLIDALAIIVVPLIVVGSPIDALKRAERRLFAQAWNLRQLMPDEAQRAVGETMAAAEELSTRCVV